MILVVVASEFEAKALPKSTSTKIVVSGIGAVAAALATQQEILKSSPSVVLSVGIAGAYVGSGLEIGDVLLATQSIYASLGCEDGNDFLPISQLGFALFKNNQNSNQFETFGAMREVQTLAKKIWVACGEILTLETVTGSQETAKKILLRYPKALAEAMEGAGVAHAAALHGIPFLELRAISNMVGPRDKSKWETTKALEILSVKFEQLISEL